MNQLRSTNQLRSELVLLTGGLFLLFKEALLFLAEMLTLVSMKNYDFCLGYFSSSGNWNCQINDGWTLVRLV